MLFLLFALLPRDSVSKGCLHKVTARWQRCIKFKPSLTMWYHDGSQSALPKWVATMGKNREMWQWWIKEGAKISQYNLGQQKPSCCSRAYLFWPYLTIQEANNNNKEVKLIIPHIAMFLTIKEKGSFRITNRSGNQAIYLSIFLATPEVKSILLNQEYNFPVAKIKHRILYI